ELEFAVTGNAMSPTLLVEATGGNRLCVEADGSLAVSSDGGQIRLRRPHVVCDEAANYDDGAAVQFSLQDATTARLQATTPSSDTPKSMSSAIEWSSFVGGTNAEFVEAVRIDEQGAVTLAGETWSLDFPATPGAYQTTPGIPPDGQTPTDIF